MESDSSQNDFSRYSIASSNNNTIDGSESNLSNNQTTNDSVIRSNQSSVNYSDDVAEESVIIKPKKKKGKKLIIDSDSESDEKPSESDDESDEKKSESESDEDKSKSEEESDEDRSKSEDESGERQSETDNELDEKNSGDEHSQIDVSMKNKSDVSNGSKRKSNRNSKNGFSQPSFGNRRSYNTNESDSSLINNKIVSRNNSIFCIYELFNFPSTFQYLTFHPLNCSIETDKLNQQFCSITTKFLLNHILNRIFAYFREFPFQNSDDESIHVPESDCSEDDDDYEKERSQMHVFSPRTRRSITGRRSIKPFRADSEDDDDDDDDEIFSNDPLNESTASGSSVYKSAEEKENDAAEHIKRNRSIAPNDSMRTPNAKRFSLNNADISASTPSHSNATPDIEFSINSNASQTSDMAQITGSSLEIDKKSMSDVVLLDSSDEENRQPFANSTRIDFKGVGTSTPGTSGKLVQPKLPFGRQQLKTSKTFVSRDYYNKKSDELIRIKQEHTHNTELLGKMAMMLPDKGNNLKIRIKQLQQQVQKMEEELGRYAIEEDNLDDVVIVPVTNSNQPRNVAKDWRSELETIQPRWTGQQGLSTFNTQKTLTLNRIEKLHKAMDKCPVESDLAQHPDNLNVQLMPHQLYAIKWMRWRENQKPKGGILADDMGLGKNNQHYK